MYFHDIKESCTRFDISYTVISMTWERKVKQSRKISIRNCCIRKNRICHARKGRAENPSSFYDRHYDFLPRHAQHPVAKREKLVNPTLDPQNTALQVAVVRGIQVAVSTWKTTLQHRQYGTQIPLHVVASGWRGQTSSIVPYIGGDPPFTSSGMVKKIRSNFCACIQLINRV